MEINDIGRSSLCRVFTPQVIGFFVTALPNLGAITVLVFATESSSV